MKKVIFIVICLTMVIIPNTSWSNDKEKLTRAICVENIGNLAEIIMMKRQQGIGMDRLFEAMDKIQSEPQVKTLIHHMIIEAYKVSEYNTGTYKNKAVRDYKNQMILMCIEVYSKD